MKHLELHIRYTDLETALDIVTEQLKEGYVEGMGDGYTWWIEKLEEE